MVHRILSDCVDAVRGALGGLVDDEGWDLTGTRPGQYRSDLVADDVAVDRLLDAGLGVLSEESGMHEPDRDVVVVVDPLDGSTNASRGIRHSAVSLCAVDEEGPLAGLVSEVFGDRRWWASRGGGAYANRGRWTPSGGGDGEVRLRISEDQGSVQAVPDAIIGLSGYPHVDLGWKQFRAFGAIALDLCMVAQGSLDGFADCSVDAHGCWDYLAGALICQEAGAVVVDLHGRDLVAIEHGARRTPVAASNRALLDDLIVRMTS